MPILKDTAEDIYYTQSAGFFFVMQSAALAVFSDHSPATGMLKICDQAVYFCIFTWWDCEVGSLHSPVIPPLWTLCLNVCMCLLASLWSCKGVGGCVLTAPWLTRLWRQLTKMFWTELFLCVTVDLTWVDNFTNPCPLPPSEVDLVLWLETTWPQVEQGKTMEAFHWILTTCTCSSKVSLFLYFCRCCDMCCTRESQRWPNYVLCWGDTISLSLASLYSDI